MLVKVLFECPALIKVFFVEAFDWTMTIIAGVSRVQSLWLSIIITGNMVNAAHMSA